MNSYSSNDKQGVYWEQRRWATLVCSCNRTVALIAFLFARKVDLNLRCHFMFAAKYVAHCSCPKIVSVASKPIIIHLVYLCRLLF